MYAEAVERHGPHLVPKLRGLLVRGSLGREVRKSADLGLLFSVSGLCDRRDDRI